MTGYGPGPAALLPGHDADVGRPPRRIDAVTLLSCYAFLLMAIPSSLVVGSFGAAGAPAALLAVAILCWYLVARQHPGLGLDRGRQPARVAATIFAGAVVAAYISASRHAVPAAQQSGADRGLIVLAGWFGVLALAADGIDQADRLRTLLRRIVMLATAMAALGVIEFCTGVDLTKYIVIPGLSVHQQADGSRKPRWPGPGDGDDRPAARVQRGAGDEPADRPPSGPLRARGAAGPPLAAGRAHHGGGADDRITLRLLRARGDLHRALPDLAPAANGIAPTWQGSPRRPSRGWLSRDW